MSPVWKNFKTTFQKIPEIVVDEGIHKYLQERATRNNKTHQIILSEKSLRERYIDAAVSAYGVELEQFNERLYGVSPSLCLVENMSCPFCVNCQVFDSAFHLQLQLGLESLKLYSNTTSHPLFSNHLTSTYRQGMKIKQ